MEKKRLRVVTPCTHTVVDLGGRTWACAQPSDHLRGKHYMKQVWR